MHITSLPQSYLQLYIRSTEIKYNIVSPLLAIELFEQLGELASMSNHALAVPNDS